MSPFHQTALLSPAQLMNRQPLIVSPTESVAAVIEQMAYVRGVSCALTAEREQAVDLAAIAAEIDVGYALVMTAGELTGIFTERDLVALVAQEVDLNRLAIAAVMSQPVITINQSEIKSIFSVTAAFQQHQVRHLPVLDEAEKLLGVITLTTLRQALQPLNFLKLRQISDVMLTQVIQAAPTTSVLALANLMSAHRISCVVITEARFHLGRTVAMPVGIVTERDIIQLKTLGLNASRLQAAQVMSTPLFCLYPHDSLWQAHQQMQQRRIRRLGVQNEAGELVGIVTQTSLLQVLDPTELLGEIEQLQQLLQDRSDRLEQTNHQLRQEVDQRQRLESQLQIANAALEKRVSLQTAQLIQTNQQLRQEVAERQQSEQALDRVFSITPSMLCTAGLDGYFKRLNPSFSQTLGYSNEELQAHPLVNFVHPSDRSATLAELQRLAAGKRTIAFENRYRCRDGSYRWLLWNAVTHPDEQLIYASARDITERKQAEALLEQERDFIAAVLDTVGALIVVLDRQGQILRFNRTCEAITGYQTVEVRGRCPWDFLLLPAERAAVKAVFQQLVRGQAPSQYENYWVSKDDSKHLISWSNTVITNEQGQVEYVIATGLDVTERRKAERRLERQSRQNQLLTEVTRKISQSLRLEEILHTIVTEVQGLLACDRVLVVQQQADGSSQLVDEAVLAPWPAMLAQPEAMTQLLMQSLRLQEASQQGQRVAIADSAHALTADAQVLLERFAVQSELVVPVFYQAVLWGFLLIHQCDRPRQWDQAEISLVQQLADQLGLAVTQAQLLDTLEERVSQRTAELTQINHQLQQEIRDRQQTEAALRESQQKLAGILDTADEGVISVDEVQIIQLFNQGAERIFGYPAAEVLGQPLSILLPGLFQTSDRRSMQALAETEVSAQPMAERSRGVVGRRRNGQEFPAEASISKLQTEQGLVFTIILKDVTERRQAEAALRRSEEKLRLTTDALPVLIAYVDRQQCYQFNNLAYESWFGLSREAIRGCRVRDVIGEAAYRQIQDYLAQGLAGETVSYEIEMPYLTGDRWISASYIPDVQQGEVRGLFTLVSDISDRKATERLRDEFVSVVSHELRTPLTSVHGSLKLLATGQLGTLSVHEQALIEISLKNTERLTRLINDVLDLERIESGQISMVMQVCNAGDLLLQAIATMQSMAHEAQIELTATASSVEIWADPDHILQTLTNLLSNAIKFSPPQTTVQLAVTEQTSTVLFAVQDQGRGIPPDKLETIFERFQQVDASDSRKRGGTGLGLAICRNIVQQHHGHIWAENRPEAGSTFYFTLPKPVSKQPL
ncbi:MAG: PAS domain S-box protein [Leptolyngbya sp. SIO4C5]|nr:PAS domain S-box protein [Leptolyngbya sp. SIO4C5]